MSTILIQNLPTIEVRDGLIHFTGADSGIEFACSRHLFFRLVSKAQKLASRLESGTIAPIRGKKRRAH